MRSMGFGKQVELLEQGKCTQCEKKVNVFEFKDHIDFREYLISGLCQKCQDQIFLSTE